MQVTKVGLVDFRSYPEVLVQFDPGVTTLIGSNGVGKTNVVEAIGYASTLGSHRVATDAPLVRKGAERALVRVEVLRDGRDQLVEIEIVPGRANRARLNRGSPVRPRDVAGIVRTVIFAPEDLALVKGDPAERRRLLDDLLVLRHPRFAGVRADYDRVLKQRNALLKSASATRSPATVESTLQVWDDQMVALGAEVVVARDDLVRTLLGPAADAYANLAPTSGAFALEITSSFLDRLSPDAVPLSRGDVMMQLGAALTSRRREELARGVTVVGPHRDDLLISLGEHPAKGYASHGESWSCALALRLGAYDVLRKETEGGDPVLILDDVFAELDVQRRMRLADLVVGAEQVIVTAAVAADVPAAIDGRQLVVELGSIRRADES
ncbi:MAG: DNA replication/repair protein RecF [Actinobacteria bacterium]|uniref:DNA replication and repair protein RecF n=1 Tax=freshwater metagenome TaxID=449393 RepID=A0A6J7L7A4_9ZZZZ|nr:DNA replication/repair protein RecF [Actinomycetota bacterium]MSW42818.1 DNA replication/repair protein RecF [Actinomycetota bacterium]